MRDTVNLVKDELLNRELPLLIFLHDSLGYLLMEAKRGTSTVFAPLPLGPKPVPVLHVTRRAAQPGQIITALLTASTGRTSEEMRDTCFP
jgi:hypothetical protein